MSDAVKIREAISADISSILELDQRSAGLAHWTPQEYIRVVANKASHSVLVAESGNGTLIGFLAGRRIGDEWDLENIVVEASRQKQGVAGRLLSAFIDLVGRERAKSIHLEVRFSNVAAIALYSKFGFAQNGSRKSYYSDPAEDAILFSLSLENSS